MKGERIPTWVFIVIALGVGWGWWAANYDTTTMPSLPGEGRINRNTVCYLAPENYPEKCGLKR